MRLIISKCPLSSEDQGLQIRIAIISSIQIHRLHGIIRNFFDFLYRKTQFLLVLDVRTYIEDESKNKFEYVYRYDGILHKTRFPLVLDILTWNADDSKDELL